jgi:hypothetical protein
VQKSVFARSCNNDLGNRSLWRHPDRAVSCARSRLDLAQRLVCQARNVEDASLDFKSLWALSRNGIKFTSIMGAYKGRVNLRQRRKRFAKEQRIKALATTKKQPTSPRGATQQGTT